MNPRALSGLAAVLTSSLALGGCGGVHNDGHMFQRWADAVATVRVTEDDARAAPAAQATPVRAEAELVEQAPVAEPVRRDGMQVQLVDALQMPTERAAGLRQAIALVDSQLQGLRAPAEVAEPVLRPAAVAPAGGLVQLASFADEAAARRAWAVMKGAHGDALAGLDARFERVDLGAKGVWVRLKAGPVAGPAQAARVCSAAADPHWCASAFARASA